MEPPVTVTLTADELCELQVAVAIAPQGVCSASVERKLSLALDLLDSEKVREEV